MKKAAKPGLRKSKKAVPRGRAPAPKIISLPLPLVEVEGALHRICFINQAFCDLVQKKRADLLGQPFSTIVANGPRCVSLLNRVYETGAYEVFAEPDESVPTPSYWLCAMWPMPGKSGRPVRVIIQLTRVSPSLHNAAAVNEGLIISGLRQHELRREAEDSNQLLQREVQERKTAEAALEIARAKLQVNSEQLEEKIQERTQQLRSAVGDLELFVHSLVHDLRAPLRAIQGYASLALDLHPSKVHPEALNLLARVIGASARMDSLIQDVLSLNTAGRRLITLSCINIETLVRSVVEEHPQLSSLQTQIKIESPLLPMQGHEASLSQCVTNLLFNAIKFVKPGDTPEICVRSERVSAASPQTEVLPAAGSSTLGVMNSERVRLWIEDKGIGIPAEYRKSIFRIFERLHSEAEYAGTGIGLAIVQKAVERMHGEVGFESDFGNGSRFWIELPAC